MAKKHWSEDFIRIAGIAVLAFLFALAPTGCNGVVTEAAEPYTFRFKVKNESEYYTITRIEFLNGTNDTARVLRYGELNLGPNRLSDEYRVRGFTEEYMTDERYYAVKITCNDGSEVFKYWHCGPSDRKIMVTLSYDFWYSKKTVSFNLDAW
jgi:hypothetical protein